MNSRSVVPKLLALGLLSVAGYYAIWGGEYTALDLHRLKGQKEVESRRLADTRGEVDSLQALAQRLENDPATIEAVARERFGMVRNGEILYRFLDVETESADTTTP